MHKTRKSPNKFGKHIILGGKTIRMQYVIGCR